MKPTALQPAFVLLLTWAALCTAAHAQTAPATCDRLNFGLEVLSGVAGHNVCPKQLDSVLSELQARIKNAPEPARTPRAETSGVFTALRALQARYRETPSWGAAFVRGIDIALQSYRDKRRPLASFANARTPNEDVDPLECLWVVGEAGADDYQCFIVGGATRPTNQPGKPTIAIHELRDYAQAYEVYSVLVMTRSALLKLDLPGIDAVLSRLKTARSRWSNLRRKGYVQYPWELGLSGASRAYGDYTACFAGDSRCTGQEGLDPERWRLIALHPGVGFGLVGFGPRQKIKPSADAALSLSLEAIGFTSYNASFAWYWGLAAGAVVDDGQFGDTRFGLFAHLTRFVHVGYLLSVMQPSTRGDATLFVSMDLGSTLGLDFH
jgi:hypothetical protein